MVKDRERRIKRHKKAPDAPKKALSPYILFSKDVREEVKNTLPVGTKATEIIKVVAQRWGELTEGEKSTYLEASERDKQRYTREMDAYDGPHHIPIKSNRHGGGSGSLSSSSYRRGRAMGAPKRATCAFLFYTRAKRPEIKQLHPEMKNTEISAELGRLWNDLGDEEKQPYVELSTHDKERYQSEKSAYEAKTNAEEGVAASSASSSMGRGGVGGVVVNGGLSLGLNLQMSMGETGY